MPNRSTNGRRAQLGRGLIRACCDGACRCQDEGSDRPSPSFMASKHWNTISLPHPINAMKAHPALKIGGLLCLLFLAPPGGASAQDTTKLIPNPRILYSSTVRTPDGGSTTYQRIEPPTAEQLTALAAARNAAAAPQAPVSAPLPLLSLTARVYDGTLTELKWVHEGIECRAWSSVDFRLLEAIPQFEHGGEARRLMSITTTQVRPPVNVASSRPWPAFPAEVLAAVPPGMRAWYVLMEFGGVAEHEAAACAAVDALHAYVEANWDALQARRVQREAQKVADAAYKAAHPEPPPAPENIIIQFWKEERP